MKNQTEKQHIIHIIHTTSRVPWLVKLAVSVALKCQRYSRKMSARRLRQLGIKYTSAKRAICEATDLGLLNADRTINLASPLLRTTNGKPIFFKMIFISGTECDLKQQAIHQYFQSLQDSGRNAPVTWSYVADVLGCDPRTAKMAVLRMPELKVEKAGDRFAIVPKKRGSQPTLKPRPVFETRPPAKTSWQDRLDLAIAEDNIVAYLKTENGIEPELIVAATNGMNATTIRAVLATAAEHHRWNGRQSNLWPLAKQMLTAASKQHQRFDPTKPPRIGRY